MSSLKKFSSEEVRNSFTDSFRNQIAIPNYISTFQVECERAFFGDGTPTDISVKVMAYAEAPVLSDFTSKKVDGSKVVINDGLINEVVFELVDALSLTDIEYILVYRHLEA